MNIKVPNGKSSTVIIVGQNSPEHKPDMFMKRIDSLEKKVDRYYSRPLHIQERKDNNSQLIERLHKSFMKRLDRFFIVHKSLLDKTYDKRLSDLRNELNLRLRQTENSNKQYTILSALNKKLNSLENIAKTPPKPQIIQQKTVRIVQNQENNDALVRSFSALLKRIENRIVGVKQMIPSAS